MKLWDVTRGEGSVYGQTVEGHFSYVWSVSFSADGSKIAPGSYDETVKLWM